MSERLFIRLGSNINEPCAWLVWSEQEQEIIASGELADARALSTLSERAGNRAVDVLVAGDAVSLTTVTLPEKGQRQALKALPFMLEESLAQSVDELHFVPGPRDGDTLHVAVVAHSLVQEWLSWLQDAGLKPRKLVPDCLALPLQGMDWALMEFHGQMLLRRGIADGISVSRDWFDVLFPTLLEQRDTPPAIACYSQFAAEGADCQPQPLELPLLIMAQGYLDAPFNLLCGRYTPKREYSKQLLPWKKVAVVAAIALVLGVANKGLNIYQLHSQTAALQAQTETLYRQVAGNSRIVNVRSQMESLLRSLQGQGAGGELFEMLGNLQQAFKQVPELKPNNLRFDGSRSEIRMQVTAKDYAQIEKFKALAGDHFQLDAGAMNSVEGAVTSTLTLRSK
ncbi:MULTISPECIES: type II secretion system protein GspL [Shewanella]|uniref:type II secretion system protein GspL n=1 Tax=Shewanella TaxID=22 RepID=UPI0016781759|nr:type II secretion system protein GspL [Shewanella fodinae]MCL2906764.1 type II secretion system protein GspL [Shewanella fodinae]GGZ02578.1 type II secretion system protein L [Shewanella fodinae]